MSWTKILLVIGLVGAGLYFFGPPNFLMQFVPWYLR